MSKIIKGDYYPMQKEKLYIFYSILIIVLLIISFQYQSLNLGMFADDFIVFRSYSSQELIKSFYSDTTEIIFATPSYRPIVVLAVSEVLSIGV